MLPTPPQHYGAQADDMYGYDYPLGVPDLPAAHFGNTSQYTFDRFSYDGYAQQYQHQKPAPQLMADDLGRFANGFQSMQKPSNIYQGAGAPILPPVRVPNRARRDYSEATTRSKRTSSVTQKPKEEKVGGVTAHLDYVMEEMVDFVAEMTQSMYAIFISKVCLADIDMTRSIMGSDAAVHPAFRKFVSQVLTSTRLPSSTILLGLHYMAVRMTILSERRNYSYDGADVYSMLTTALLLGSKFLDDNTFQNRSWSDVSNIPVSRLNMLESDWLKALDWNLHFEPKDPKGFELWRRRWQSYHAKKIDSLAESMKQACLENRFAQLPKPLQPLSPITQYPLQFPETRSMGAYQIGQGSQQWSASPRDSWTPSTSQNHYSPPSAPETGPTTPDHAFAYDFGYNRLPPPSAAFKAPPPLHIVSSNVPSGAPLTPYTPQSGQHFTLGRYCGCQQCIPQPDRYMMGPRYGQPVFG